jgi:hypothetical protein
VRYQFRDKEEGVQQNQLSNPRRAGAQERMGGWEEHSGTKQRLGNSASELTRLPGMTDLNAFPRGEKIEGMAADQP